jgi:hypothetical protein
LTTQAHGACTIEFQYAVKVVCGEVNVPKPPPPPQPPLSTPVAPGNYWTATNIHNPDKCKDASFRWKVAVAGQVPPGPTPGPVSAYSRILTLRPDEALEIDCSQVMKIVLPLFHPPLTPPTFVKGYVVIVSVIELDVVAVYTGTQAGTTLLSSFHTERVQPRCVPVCEDLVLPLNTGFAGWQTVLPTVGPLGPAVPVTPAGSWASLLSAPPSLPFGSSWVSQNSTDGVGTPVSGSLSPAIVKYYELCFDLCSGFTVPAPFPIQVAADDSAQVFLNNGLVGVGQVGSPSGGTGYQTMTTLNVNPNLLRAGSNCFRVEVKNGPAPHGGATGFALAGILRVVRGKCPCSPLPIAAPSHGPAGLDVQSADPSVGSGGSPSTEG